VISEALIKNCIKLQPAAQREVYDKLSPALFRTCMRYVKDEVVAEEILGDALYIVFTKMHQLKTPQALEGWARKITVNECLGHLKKRLNFNIYIDDLSYSEQPLTLDESQLETLDLLKMVEKLPAGCATIFNLYVIEGYGHKEIADQLGISEGTSKSQLNVAKTKLKKMIQINDYPEAQ